MNETEARETFAAWLEQVCASEEPDSSIIAYNFGLYESVSGYVVYLVGSTEYAEDDPDWACNEDFVPRQRCVTLPDSVGVEWQAIQSLVEGFVRQFIAPRDATTCFLLRARAITVGFDDGDLTTVQQAHGR